MTTASGVLDRCKAGATSLEIINWSRRVIAGTCLMLRTKDAPPDRALALDEGASEHATKPFGSGALPARLGVLFRRSRHARSPLPRCGSPSIDPVGRGPSARGAPSALTSRRLAILKLLSREGLVVERRSIALRASHDDAEVPVSDAIAVRVSLPRATRAFAGARSETLRGSRCRLVAA